MQEYRLVARLVLPKVWPPEIKAREHCRVRGWLLTVNYAKHVDQVSVHEAAQEEHREDPFGLGGEAGVVRAPAAPRSDSRKAYTWPLRFHENLQYDGLMEFLAIKRCSGISDAQSIHDE